jgi:CheY-like chemotaxis protein
MTPSKFQILLIDDSESDAKLFQLALTEAAPRVKLYWVATGDEGIDYLRRENRFQDAGAVDLIICDLNMAGMTGFDLLAKVKRDRICAPIPLVVYSGSSAAEDVLRSYALGANSYIVKPMTIERMVQQLKTLVHYWLETVALPNLPIAD